VSASRTRNVSSLRTVDPSRSNEVTHRRETSRRRGALRLVDHDRRERGSWSLTGTQVTNIRAAAVHAVKIGLPLNRFVTINLEAGGSLDCVKSIGRFLKLQRDWIASKDAELAYVWTQESAPCVGQHAHILLHVPPPIVRQASNMHRRWLAASGVISSRGIIRTKPVGRSYRHALVEEQYGERYWSHLQAAIGYILKQDGDVVSRPYRRPGKSCLSFVEGKRCGTSQNIGASARVKARSLAECP